METIESLKAEIARLKSSWHVETLVRKDAIIAKQEAENDRLKAELTAQQSPAVAVPDNKFGDNLLWFLREFANADDDQLEYAELEIYGESESGVEGTCTVTVQEICKAAADVIESLNQSPRITEQDASDIYRSAIAHFRNVGSYNATAWLHMNGRALLAKLSGVEEE